MKRLIRNINSSKFIYKFQTIPIKILTCVKCFGWGGTWNYIKYLKDHDLKTIVKRFYWNWIFPIIIKTYSKVIIKIAQYSPRRLPVNFRDFLKINVRKKWRLALKLYYALLAYLYVFPYIKQNNYRGTCEKMDKITSFD